MQDDVGDRRRQSGNALIMVAVLAAAIGAVLALVPQERWRQWFDQPVTVTRGSEPASRHDVARDGQYALVIGNTNYEYKRLVNPANDARSMAELLRARGFEVSAHYDLNSTQLQEAVRAFGQRLRGNGAVGLVYFSGHGTEIDGENYLMPVDNRRIADHVDVRQYAVSLSYVLARLRDADVPLKLVILDACRDDPFPDRGKSAGRGLAAISSPNGTLIAYAAAPKQRASDNPNAANGLYTQHLLAALQQPGRRIEDVFIDVKRSVFAASNGRQEPWYNASLDSRYCLGGCEPANADVAIADEPIQPIRPMAHVELTVRPTPVDAQVRIMNIAPVYRDGIALEVGEEYDIEVSAPGYEIYRRRQSFAAGRRELEVALAEERTLAHGEVIRDRLNDGSEGPEMVFLLGGRFQMGSPGGEDGREDDERQHTVTVGDVLIARTEVTVGQFRRFVQSSGYRTDAERSATGMKGCWAWDVSDGNWGWRTGRNWRNPGFTQRDDSPAHCVSWNDARAYIEWLSAQTGEEYRLPTEAEWEYAARAGTETSLFWGDWGLTCAYANVADLSVERQYGHSALHSCEDGYAWTAPAGSYRPNPWGLSDMLGNVWEWTCSTYDEAYGGAENRCDADAKYRVLRGGAWSITFPSWPRVADRHMNSPAYQGDETGFRPARSP